MKGRVIDADAYPLYWPERWPRTARRESTTRYKITFSDARERAVHEAKLLGASDVVLSTNIPLRRDGLPRMDLAEPTDPGVALYWVAKQTPRVIACDRWLRVRDNMRAVGLALEALRALQRSGATEVFEKAYTGFAALPANAGPTATPWRDVFGFGGTELVTMARLEDVYVAAARAAHPDRGGSHERMVVINAAYDAAKKDVRAGAAL